MVYDTYSLQGADTSEATPAKGSLILLETGSLIGQAAAKSTKSRNKILREADFMKKYGPTEPITVQIEDFGGAPLRYRIKKGEEIWQAACLAGIQKLPCLLLADTAQDRQKAYLLAQIRLKSFNIFEKARAIRSLLDAYHLTQEEIARQTGVSQSAIANKLRLLRLSPREQEEILEGNLCERHARALLRLSSSQEREHCIAKIREEQLTVADTEAWIDRILSEKVQISEDSEAKTSSQSRKAPPFESKSPSGSKPASAAFFQPRKFVLTSLLPLYNSIEKILAIFRKTGCDATLATEEGEKETKITIIIPKAP